MEAPSWTIDDRTLRERPDDVEAARRRILELETTGPSGDAERTFWLRVLGELDAAERLGRDALARAGGTASPPDWTTGLEDPAATGSLSLEALGPALRLAVVLQWQRRFEEADALFRAALRTAEAHTGTDRRAQGFVPFAHQHLGKSLFDQGRFSEALAHFRTALQCRLDQGAPADQVDSSRQAIAAVEAQLTRGGGPPEDRSLPGAPTGGRQ